MWAYFLPILGAFLTTFAKSARSHTDLIALLALRGLVVSDQLKAERTLASIGYFRLSGYTLLLEIPGTYTPGFSGRSIYQRSHVFRAGSTFDQLVELYEFDRHLRLLVLDAIERVEVAVRAALNDHMATKYGEQWLLDPSLFNERFTSPGRRNGFTQRDELRRTIERETRMREPNKRNAFCEHYFETYTHPAHPPAWMIAEQLSLGTWSKVYQALEQRANKKVVATPFGTSPKEFGSWLHALSYLRNLCAHHARLLDVSYIIVPEASPSLPVSVNHRKFAGFAAVLWHLLKRIAPMATWSQRLADLCQASPNIDVQLYLGLAPSWERDPFWT